MNRIVSLCAVMTRAGRALPLLAALLASPSSLRAQSSPPNAINFQGRLATPSGNPVSDGNYTLRLRLYSAATGGLTLHDQTFSTVPVKNGTFAVKISGFSTFSFYGEAWLGIQIGNAAELTPRTQVVSVPYAIKSELALTVPEGSITNDKLAGGITGDKLANGTLNGTAWLLGGNSSVTSGFLGTTDAQPLVFKTNNIERMRILSGGNIGIGNTTPVAPLSFGNSIGEKITLYGQSASGNYGMGVQGNLLLLHSDFSGSDIAFGYGSATNFSEVMRVKGDGNIGIGTTAPGAKVDIRVSNAGVGLNISDGTRNLVIKSPTQSQGLNGMAIGTLNDQGLYFMTNNLVRGAFSADGSFKTTAGALLSGGAIITDGALIEDGLSVSGGMSVHDGMHIYSGLSVSNGLSVSGDLYVSGGLSVRGLPFGDYRNVQWNEGTGEFYYDNSSRKHKRNITPLVDDFDKLMQAVPMTYTRPNAPGRWEIGFIAEDFDAIGLKRLVDYGKDGEVEGINYEKICLYLTAIAKRQQQTIENQGVALENQRKEIDDLKQKMEKVMQMMERERR